MMSFEERCRRLTEIAHHYISDFGTISSAAALKIGAAEQAAYQQHLAPGSILWALIQRGVLKGITSEADIGKLARVLASQSVASAERVLSAACIVLAHSVADDVFSECCTLAVDCDPAGWISEIDMDRRVTLRELREKGTEAVFAQELQKLANQLRGKSLPVRAGILFRRAPVVQHKESSPSDPDYFRLSTLKELDDLRHDIVHRGGMGVWTCRSQQVA